MITHSVTQFRYRYETSKKKKSKRNLEKTKLKQRYMWIQSSIDELSWLNSPRRSLWRVRRKFSACKALSYLIGFKTFYKTEGRRGGRGRREREEGYSCCSSNSTYLLEITIHSSVSFCTNLSLSNR